MMKIYFVSFAHVLRILIQGLYSQTTLKNVLSLVLQNFLYLVAYEYNTTCDWLNHTV